MRAEIAGSLWAQHAFLNHIQVEDTNVKGAIKANNSLIPRGLEVDNANVLGDIDVARSYFSELAILKTRVTGVVDIGETQTRCAYDIRSNELGDLVAIDVGFGSNAAETEFRFKANEKNSDPCSRFYLNSYYVHSQIESRMKHNPSCVSDRFVNPGTFIFVNNRIKAPLCIRSPRWLEGMAGVQSESNFYLAENNINGATWLNFSPKARDSKTRDVRVCDSLAAQAQFSDNSQMATKSLSKSTKGVKHWILRKGDFATPATLGPPECGHPPSLRTRIGVS